MSAREDGQSVDPGAPRRKVCGLDWASQPPGRAAVVLSKHGDGLHLDSVDTGVSDSYAIQLCRDPGFAAVGVDVPFGWPSESTRFVTGWQADGGPTAPPEAQAFRYRVTDRVVRDRLGKHPLSVSSDLISLAARSWVSLVHQAGLGPQVDCGLIGAPRSGPPLIEVYPGAALAAICGARPAIRSDGYKKDAGVRRELLTALVGEFHLELDGKEEALIGSGLRCDAFDALVAALTTAVYAGWVTGWSICRPAPGIDPATLRREGWIYFPVPDVADPSVEPGLSARSRSALKRRTVRAQAPATLPATAPVQAPEATPGLDPEGLTAADVVNRRARRVTGGRARVMR